MTCSDQGETAVSFATPQLQNVAVASGAGDDFADLLSSLAQGIVGEMGVARRRGRADVPEQLADDWQAQAARSTDRCKAVPEVIEARIEDPDRPPRTLGGPSRGGAGYPVRSS